MALSVSFIRLVSSTNVTQATRLRPSTSVGLAPTEQTSLCWTHWVANSKSALNFERLIGTIRREYLDQTFFWTAADLEEKLQTFERYFNRHRTHSGLEGRLPEPGDASVSKLR